MSDVVMPQMGESIVEGTITKWLKQPGDQVEKDEPLLEISTDKVDSEVPSPIAGTLKEVLFNEGDVVEINKVIARIDAGSPPEVVGSHDGYGDHHRRDGGALQSHGDSLDDIRRRAGFGRFGSIN